MHYRQATPEIVACPNCGADFVLFGRKRFCASKCQVAFGNRMAAEGKVLAPLIKAWLAGRGGGHTPQLPVAGEAMRELTRIGKLFNDADKAAGRPPVHEYVARDFEDGAMYEDRARR